MLLNIRVQVEWAQEYLDFKWSGGHTINVYNGLGHNLDCFSVGDFRVSDATVAEVMAGIASYVASAEF